MEQSKRSTCSTLLCSTFTKWSKSSLVDHARACSALAADPWQPSRIRQRGGIVMPNPRARLPAEFSRRSAYRGYPGSHPHSDRPNWRPSETVDDYLRNCREGLEEFSERRVAHLMGLPRMKLWQWRMMAGIPEDLFERLLQAKPSTKSLGTDRGHLRRQRAERPRRALPLLWPCIARASLAAGPSENHE